MATGLYHALGLRGAPAGACCQPAGACAVVIELGCPVPGIWQGAGTGCLPNVCPQPNGACCTLAGVCSVTTQIECEAPRAWQGADTSCDPNPCVPATGACCVPASACIISLEADCSAPNTWQGVDTSCTPDPCLVGACCLNLYCLLTTEIECHAYLGRFQGNATACDPNPCLAASVTGSSRITSSLRVWVAPNPSRGQTLLQYELPPAATATLQIFDAAGSLVRRFPLSPRTGRQGATPWDGRDDAGLPVSAGIYLVRLATPTGAASARAILVR